MDRLHVHDLYILAYMYIYSTYSSTTENTLHAMQCANLMTDRYNMYTYVDDMCCTVLTHTYVTCHPLVISLRVELTVNLPKLEPFTRDHHASWVMDSRENTPVLDSEEIGRASCRERV